MCYQLILLVCFLENMSDQRGPVCGGISEELQGENLQEALNLLEKSLANLASGDGPEFKWAIICLFLRNSTFMSHYPFPLCRVVKVKSVTSQVVAGTLYHLKVQLSQGDNIKDSYVKIWYRPWLQENGTNIKINFDGDEQTIEKTF